MIIAQECLVAHVHVHVVLVMLLLVFYNCVYIPIELFFLNGIVTHGDYPKALAHRVIDYFVDILFFIDILLNTCTVR